VGGALALIFADTSGLYAALVAADQQHVDARTAWLDLLARRQRLVTTSYVVHETVSLLQARIGISAVLSWRTDIEPVLDIVWVDATLHRLAMAAVVASGRRDLSLTDWVSFEVMRQSRIRVALAVDRHFLEQGFELLPKRSG